MPFEIGPCHDDERIHGARCQEASMFSKEDYIPCNALAVAIVHHDKDGRSYYMCAQCADHNLRNRGGRLVRVKEGWKRLAVGLASTDYAVDLDSEDPLNPRDPNYDNLLESPEFQDERAMRVRKIVRRSVDERLGRQKFLGVMAITLTDVELAYLLGKIGPDRVLRALGAVQLAKKRGLPPGKHLNKEQKALLRSRWEKLPEVAKTRQIRQEWAREFGVGEMSVTATVCNNIKRP